MDREEIIRTAREAEVSIRAHYDETGSTPQELERFFNAAYAAGAAAEREACARLCDQMFHDWCDQEFEDEDEAYRNKPDAEDCKKAIRARGEK